MLRAGADYTAKAGTDLEPHRRREGHHRLCQISLELVEHRFTESNGDIPGHGFDNPTEGVAVPSRLIDTLRHLLAGSRIWTSDETGFNLTSVTVSESTSASIVWTCLT